jgi:hypothetical protein
LDDFGRGRYVAPSSPNTRSARPRPQDDRDALDDLGLIDDDNTEMDTT